MSGGKKNSGMNVTEMSESRAEAAEATVVDSARAGSSCMAHLWTTFLGGPRATTLLLLAAPLALAGPLSPWPAPWVFLLALLSAVPLATKEPQKNHCDLR